MIKVMFNGQQRDWDGDPDLPLLWFLRDEVGLTGTKYGCGQALCGSCTVIVDKQAVRACITSVSDVVGREVTTIEGLHPTGDHPVQKAWRQINVPQCGLLPDRPDHAGRSTADGKSKTHARSDTRSHGGQHLPLRLLPTHRKRGSSRFDGGLIMNIITNPDRLRGIEAPHQGRKNFPPQHSQGSRYHRRTGAGRTGDVAPGVRGLSRPAPADAARNGGRSRASSLPSHPMERLPSWRIAPRWEPVSGPACR